MSDYYNRAGEPLAGWWEWAQAFEHADRRVALDEVDDITVSTVWLGLDHSFGTGPPLIFETMVFGSGDEPQWRYPTEEAALAGHDRVLAWVRAGMPADREPE